MATSLCNCSRRIQPWPDSMPMAAQFCMATNFEYIQKVDYEESASEDDTQPPGTRTRLKNAY